MNVYLIYLYKKTVTAVHCTVKLTKVSIASWLNTFDTHAYLRSNIQYMYIHCGRDRKVEYEKLFSQFAMETFVRFIVQCTAVTIFLYS